VCVHGCWAAAWLNLNRAFFCLWESCQTDHVLDSPEVSTLVHRSTVDCASALGKVLDTAQLGQILLFVGSAKALGGRSSQQEANSGPDVRNRGRVCDTAFLFELQGQLLHEKLR
jgi:hypothetical protein